MVIIIVLILGGVGTLIYPHVSGWLFDRQTQGQIADFQVGGRYLELKEAFREYNEALALSGQGELSGKSAYSSFPVNPADYGVSEDMVGYIEIPSQDIRLGIYLGAGDENIARGAGIMGYTSAPIGGMDTNAVVASHNVWRGDLRFKRINRLNPGDKVYITNFWEKMTYSVVERRIIKPDDVASVLIRPGRDMVTLMTCDNYGPNGPDRCVVFCEREE